MIISDKPKGHLSKELDGFGLVSATNRGFLQKLVQKLFEG